jgi:hypothetical protein
MRREEYAASPWEGFVLGNGGMGAVVFGGPTGYTWRLNRNDLWDGRWPEAARQFRALPLDEFKAVGFSRSRNLADGEEIPGLGTMPLNRDPVPYPCRRIGADLVLRVTPEFNSPPCTQRLRLTDATLSTVFTYGIWGLQPLTVTSRVLHQRDVLALRVSGLYPHLRNAVRCCSLTDEYLV